MVDYNENMPPMEDVNFNDLVLLEEVNNDFEADVKISLLRSCSILAFKRYSQFSAVAKIYCGSSNMGVMIYVPKDDVEVQSGFFPRRSTAPSWSKTNLAQRTVQR